MTTTWNDNPAIREMLLVIAHLKVCDKKHCTYFAHKYLTRKDKQHA